MVTRMVTRRLLVYENKILILFILGRGGLQSWPKIMAKAAKNGVVLDTTSNVQPI